MCGISGIISRNEISGKESQQTVRATKKLSKRGPDNQEVTTFTHATLGHSRLAIIDVSKNANQPFSTQDGRYTITFNGTIYNYKILREKLSKEGCQFHTNSDTEVLLTAYLHYGTAFLNHLNGSFALAIYDVKEKSALLARDRFGVKPLLYFKDQNRLIFASEMKALMEYEIPKEIDNSSLYTYLQLNYIPEPHSIFKAVKKLEPGHYLKIDAANKVQKIPFYQLKYPPLEDKYDDYSYEEAQKKFLQLLDQSIEERLHTDVPLGTFLSGGVDSSLITALTAKKVKNLNTFSIGFEDEPHFDESPYARMLANKYNTNHHAFLVNKKDLLQSLEETLEYIDEPFADSSALVVNILSRETAKHVKVALSGDGADELFGGYYKHRGEYLMRQTGLKQDIVKSLSPVWEMLPKSRNSKVSNLIRKLDKFSKGSKIGLADRYWLWASLMQEADAANLMIKKAVPEIYLKRKEQLLQLFENGDDINDVLLTDVKMVLNSDMLRKVDLMSMRNGLEVRTPFLDHHLVNFAFSIHGNYKINASMGKRLVQDAARDLLPEELYNRKKQGFEVPLLPWFKNELKGLIEDDLISDAFIKEQNIFNLSHIQALKSKLYSKNPVDVQANLWAILVFNSWWKRYIV